MNPMQQKINAARQAGYSENEIRSFLGQSAPAPQAQTTNSSLAMPGTTNRGGLVMPGTSSQAPKKKNFWVDQISTAGGILGGIGGSLIAPIAGTAAGGAAGAALGETLENALTGNSLGKNVGKEALLGGIFAAGPIRGGKAVLQGGAKLLGREVAETGAKAGVRTATERGAQALLGNAWNIKSGAKLGSKVLRPQEANNLQKFVIEKIGIPRTANADMVFERAANFTDETGQAIATTIRASGKKLSTNQAKTMAANLERKFGGVLGGDATSPTAQSILNQTRSVKTPEDVWKLTRKIEDDLINFERNPNGADPLIERYATIAKTELRDVLNKLVPTVKPLNSAYSSSRQVERLVAGAANKPRGINFMNNRIGGGAAQRIQSGLGQTKLPKLAGSGIGGVTKKGIVGREVAQNLLIPRGLEDVLMDTQSDFGSNQSMMSDPAMNQSMTGLYPNSQQESSGMEQQSSNPYPKENLLSDIQRDPANATKYIAYYQQMSEIFDPVAGGDKLAQASKNSLASADNAINTLDQLESRYNAAGGGGGRIGGTFKSKLGGLGLNSDARVYDSMANASVTQIAKALAGSGAGTVSDMDAKVIMAALARFSDNPEEARAKFADLRQRLMAAKSNTMRYGAGNIEDSLIQQEAY